MSETPLRAVPIEAETAELKKATPEELKKIREQAEKDSGKSRDLKDPAYVTALNKGWAEHYGDSHPLSKKILEFKGESGEREADEKAAMDAVKSIQTQLGFTGEDVDGVISYKTIKAYNQMLENRTEADGTVRENSDAAFGVNSDLQKIDQLGAEEKQEKLKTHSEDLTQRAQIGGVEQDINGKTVQVVEENGEKVFIGTEENSNKYYSPKSGEYETKDERTARVDGEAKEKQGRLSELKAKIDGGQEQELKDLEGNALRVETIDGKKVVMGTGNDRAQKYYNLETGEYETKDEQEKQKGEQPKKDRVEDISTIQLTDGTEKKLEDQTWQEVNGKNYFRAGEELIRVDENGTFNQYTENKDWKKVDFKDLPPALQEKAGKNKLEELMNNPEFADKKIGELDDKVGGKGTEAIMEGFLASQPRPEGKSKIGELTLSQLKQFQEKPESFASSNLIPKDGTAIDPNEYGIKSEWKYAEDSVGNKIKIPVKGDITMDTIMVTDVADNKEKSQKKWLEGLVNDTSIEAGRDYVVAGSPNLMLRKEGERMIIFPAGGGDIQAEYKKGSGGEYAWAGETVEAGTLAQNN